MICVIEIKEHSATTAAITEASGATYVGFFAVAMAVIPICVIVVIDAISLMKKLADFRLKHKRSD